MRPFSKLRPVSTFYFFTKYKRISQLTCIYKPHFCQCPLLFFQNDCAASLNHFIYDIIWYFHQCLHIY